MTRRIWDPLPRLGALERWRKEIRQGRRQNGRPFDDLQAAACNEVAALECETRGDRSDAEWFMDRALLRLHGCYHEPDDGDKKNPGPGRRKLAELKAASVATTPPQLNGNPFAGLRASRAPEWAA